MNFDLKKIITAVARKHGLPFETVKLMLDAEFKCAKEAMKEGVHDEPETFKNVNFIKLGKIYAKKGVIEKMKLMKQIKKEKENGEQ
jgi:hypothetical protein